VQQQHQQAQQAGGEVGSSVAALKGAPSTTAAGVTTATAGTGQEWAEGGEDDGIWQEGVPSPYQAALQRCADVEPSLACLKEAARQKRYRGQYLFPHFMIVGWQVGLLLKGSSRLDVMAGGFGLRVGKAAAGRWCRMAIGRQRCLFARSTARRSVLPHLPLKKLTHPPTF
jgi:hypothetical protein